MNPRRARPVVRRLTLRCHHSGSSGDAARVSCVCISQWCNGSNRWRDRKQRRRLRMFGSVFDVVDADDVVLTGPRNKRPVRLLHHDGAPPVVVASPPDGSRRGLTPLIAQKISGQDVVMVFSFIKVHRTLRMSL